MEVKLDKRYPVAAGRAQCWAVLGDIRAVAACMPGAQITEQIDATHFKGAVKSKVGPAVMSFGGDIEVQGLDAATHALKMLGKGADKSGSSASMQLTAHLEDDAATPGHSVLVGLATIMVSGKLAQFGSRLLVPVSDAMLAQFADNFRAAAMAVTVAPAIDAAAPPAPGASSDQAAADAAAAAAAVNAGAPVDQLLVLPVQAPASAAIQAPLQGPGQAPGQTPVKAPVQAPAQAPAPAAAPPSTLTPAQTKDLDALALLWAAFKGWFASLFNKKR